MRTARAPTSIGPSVHRFHQSSGGFHSLQRVAPIRAPDRPQRGPYTGRGARTVGLVGDRTRSPLTPPELSLFLSPLQSQTATSVGPRRPRRRRWSVYRDGNVSWTPLGFHLSSMRSRGHAIAGENPWEAHHIPAPS